MSLAKRYKIYLYSNNPETIIKYFVTNLNKHKHGFRSGHLVYPLNLDFDIVCFGGIEYINREFMQTPDSYYQIQR